MTVKVDVGVLDTADRGLDEWIEGLRKNPMTTIEMVGRFLNPGPLLTQEENIVYTAVMLGTALQRLAGPQ